MCIGGAALFIYIMSARLLNKIKAELFCTSGARRPSHNRRVSAAAAHFGAASGFARTLARHAFCRCEKEL